VQVLLGCLAAGALFTTADLAEALHTLGRRWLSGGGVWANAALSLLVYSAFALLCVGVCRLLWRCVRRSRWAGNRLMAGLRGGSAPFALLTMLWAIAAADASLFPDVCYPRVSRDNMIWVICGLGYVACAGWWVAETFRWSPRRGGRAPAAVGATVIVVGIAGALLLRSAVAPRALGSLQETRGAIGRGPGSPSAYAHAACGVLWVWLFVGCGLAGGMAARAGRWVFLRFVPYWLGAAVPVITLIGTLIGVTAEPDPAPSPDRPPDPTTKSILLITVDALRQDFPSCYGGPVQTPSIDSLAREGIKFDNAWATSSWTRPSFASIHTSTYPTAHGVGEMGIKMLRQANTLPRGLTTLAQACHVEGYATQAFISNSQLHPVFGFSRGFDGYVMYDDVGSEVRWLSSREALYPVQVVRRRASRLIRFEFLVRRRRADDRAPYHERSLLAPSDAFLTAAAMRWLRTARRPFFLWVHYMGVHQYGNFRFRVEPQSNGGGPWDRLQRLVSATTIGGPVTEDCFPAAPRTSAGAPSLASWPAPHMLRNPVPEDIDMKHYAARCQSNLVYVDGLIGCLLGELDALGLGDRTHVLFTSDHGEEFGDHAGAWHGRTQYEEVTKVPLLVRSPAIEERGRSLAEPCSLVDLAPTILDLAQIRPRHSFQGHSLLPIVSREDLLPRIVYSEFSDSARNERKAVRWGMMKCVTASARRPLELYDLYTDPSEQTNLAATHPVRAEELLAQLRRWEHEQATLADKLRGGRQGRATLGVDMGRRLEFMGYVE